MTDTRLAIARAVNHLGVRRIYRGDGRSIVIASLVREEDWRPLHAAWWRGKEVCVIGADLEGNFFLRHCDGSVRYWEHRLQTDTVLTRSVDEFIRSIDY